MHVLKLHLKHLSKRISILTISYKNNRGDAAARHVNVAL
jgi:hypothetical protein